MESGEGSELMKAQTHILNHVFNYISSTSLKCAVELDIPDIIDNHGQPMTLSNLVEALSISPSKTQNIHGLMRLLVHSGFFAIQKLDENSEEEGYVLTPSSKFLLNKPTSMKPLVLNMIDPVFITPCRLLSDWFKRNEATAFEAVHGRSFWDYLGHHPEFSANFNEAMGSGYTGVVTDVVVKDCKEVFEGLGSLVDVGGGTGAAARAWAEVFPDMKCIVFDLPHVVANIPNCNNLEFVGGDMFESIPSADAVFIKDVLDSWNDEDCVKILKRCRESIQSKEKGGKVIVIDFVIDNKKKEYESTESLLFIDLLMMTLFNTTQRTEKEWEKLFLQSGFTHYKISHVLGLRSLIEVFP